MKKKVFFIMSTNDFSGAEAVNFRIIDGLKDKYNFYWVSRGGNINLFLKERNINWIEIDKLTPKEIKRVVKTYNPDILHATDFNASVICSIANCKIPIISHLHNNAKWLGKINIKSITYFLSSFRLKKILAVSSSIEREYIFSKLLGKNIINIGNPVNRSDILSKVNKEDYIKKYDICCVARVSDPKNPQKFIRIIAELKKSIPNIRAVWVGTGDLIEECMEMCKNLSLTKNIDFVGYKKNPYPYVASSKIFLLTSDWEGYGLVVFEALTLGLPCIVSKVGGLIDLVNDNCGKLCISESEYITSLKEIILKERKYVEMSKNAIERSRKLENFDKYMNDIDLIYKGIC